MTVSIRAYPFLLVASLSSGPLWPQAPIEDHVRIGSWNIQNLGDRDWGQHPSALAQHIQLAALDILALQEIHDTDGDASKRTNETLDKVFALLNRHDGQDWEYILFPKRDEDETEQHTGVAWNKKRLEKSGELRIPVSYAGPETWKRTPYAVKFSAGSGKTDFVVIPLHMKSNRDVSGEPAPPEIRRQEAAALAEKLDEVKSHFGDEDVIVIGDTNCLRGDEEALQAYESAGLRDLNESDAPTYKDGIAPFDRILVPRTQREFRYSYQYVMTPTKPDIHFGRLSDHFLVLAAFRILSDDDS